MNDREINLPAPLDIANDPINRACDILTSVSRSRASIYRWLSLGFYPPDRDLVEAVNQGQLSAELTEATTWLGADQKKLIVKIEKLADYRQNQLEDWQAEYNRLFSSPISVTSSRCLARASNAFHHGNPAIAGATLRIYLRLPTS